MFLPAAARHIINTETMTRFGQNQTRDVARKDSALGNAAMVTPASVAVDVGQIATLPGERWLRLRRADKKSCKQSLMLG